MDSYPGKYYIQSGEEQEATILILKDKLSIGLRDEHGNPRIVYWAYDQIIRDNHWKRGMAIVRYGTYPVQTIEVDSKEFADQLENLFKEKERPWLQRKLNKSTSRLIKFIVAILLILLTVYFLGIPFLAEKLASGVPLSYEEQLGDDLYAAIKEGYVMNERQTAYTNEFLHHQKALK